MASASVSSLLRFRGVTHSVSLFHRHRTHIRSRSRVAKRCGNRPFTATTVSPSLHQLQYLDRIAGSLDTSWIIDRLEVRIVCP